MNYRCSRMIFSLPFSLYSKMDTLIHFASCRHWELVNFMSTESRFRPPGAILATALTEQVVCLKNWRYRCLTLERPTIKNLNCRIFIEIRCCMQILNVVPSISCKCFLLEQGETSNISIFVHIKIVWFHSLWFSTFPGNFPKCDAIGRRSWSKCRKCLSIPCGSAQWASRIGTLTTGVSKITTSLNRLLGISSKNRKHTCSN